MPFLLLRKDSCNWPFEFFTYHPDNFEEIEKPPIVVFLHGSGERGSNPEQPIHGLESVFEDLQLPAIVIFPQCDYEYRAYYGDMEERVMNAVATTIQEFGADPNKVYLVGYSMGGSSNLWLAARFPDKFAGIVCIAPGITWVGAEPPPRLPPDVKELFDSMFVATNRPEKIAEQIRCVPIWFLQGTEDEPCPIEETRAVVSELRKIGSDPKITEYGGIGHETMTMALREDGLFEWLFAQAATGDGSKRHDDEGGRH